MAERSSELGSEGRRRTVVAFAALIALIAPLVVYLPTPGDYWIRFDNEELIRDQPNIRFLTFEADARSRAVVDIFTKPHSDLYQPLLVVSLAVDYALFGWDRSGFHAHSTALHLVVALGLFTFALRLSGAVWAALLAACFASLHPTSVEAVSWIIHRTLLVTAFFALAGAHAYLSYARDPRRWPWLAGATLAFTLASMAKALPSLLVVPILLDLWVRRPFSWRWVWEKLPLAAALGFLTWFNLQISSTLGQGAVDVWTTVVHVPSAVLLSAANLIWPTDLALLYPRPEVWGLLGARWLAVLAAAAAAAIGGVWLWRRGERGPLLAVAGWLALLMPSVLASAFRNSVTADRYGYVPMIVLAPGLAVALTSLRRLPPVAYRGAVGLCVVALAVMTWQARAQARLWLDEAKLWQVVLDRAPHPIALGALGKVRSERREWDGAIEAFDLALVSVEDDYPNLDGPIYHQNREKIALAALSQLRAGSPGFEARREHYLGVAEESADTGEERWPEVADFAYDRGRVLLERGEAREAERAFERAVRTDPRHALALLGLGTQLDRRGETERAIRVLWQSLEAKQDHMPTLARLSAIYERRREFSHAAGIYYYWAALRPERVEMHERFFDAVDRGFELGQHEALAKWLQQYAASFPKSEPAKLRLEIVARPTSAREAPARD